MLRGTLTFFNHQKSHRNHDIRVGEDLQIGKNNFQTLLLNDNKLQLSTSVKVDDYKIQYTNMILKLQNELLKRQEDVSILKKEITQIFEELKTNANQYDDLAKEISQKMLLVGNHEHAIEDIKSKHQVMIIYKHTHVGEEFVLDPYVLTQVPWWSGVVAWFPLNFESIKNPVVCQTKCINKSSKKSKYVPYNYKTSMEFITPINDSVFLKTSKSEFKLSKIKKTWKLRDKTINDEATIKIVNSMHLNTHLTALTLDWNDIGNIGAKSLGNALKMNKILKKLNLMGNKITCDGAIAIADGLKMNIHLVTLNLGCNMIENLGATELGETLKINKHLTTMRIESNGITHGGINEIATALKKNNTLQILDVSYNNLAQPAAVALEKSLQYNTTLIQLWLNNSKIGNEGATCLSRGLKINTTLEYLSLRSNGIGDSGAIEIAEAIRINSTLTKLNLQSNFISGDTITILNRIYYKNNNLKILRLQYQRGYVDLID